jgi:hypothetical protein
MLEKPSAQWQEADLQYLIDHEIEEGERLDYKRELSLESRSQRREAAKDISALANGRGGRIVVGLVEHDDRGSNIPVDLAPIDDVGALIDRLADVIHDLCQPSVGVTYAPVEVSEGHCLVIDVAESLAPVMLCSAERNGYYHRIDNKSWPMNERQVRERYERLSGRRTTVQTLIAEASPVPPPDEPMEPGATLPAWLTLLAVPAYGPMDLFNPATYRAPSFAELLRTDRNVGLITELPLLQPTYFGLEARWRNRYSLEVLLRLHRSGIIEYHHTPCHATNWPMAALPASRGAGVPMRLSGMIECRAIMDFLELAEALYRDAGFASELHLRGYYQRLTGWLCSSPSASSPIDHDPLAHTVDTNVQRLESTGRAFAQGLLDRVWQAAGSERCEIPIEQIP